MRTIKETYSVVIEYGKKKADAKFMYTLLMGIMGGMFIGIGYLGAIMIKGWGGEHYLSFLAAGIFPVGIIMCVFLGGGLFTSDSLSMVAFLEKKASVKNVLKGWGVVLLGNFIGALIIAGIASWAKFFNSGGNMAVLSHYVHGKENIKWYTSIGSGILCNLLVAGSIWMTKTTDRAVAKIFLLWFPITLFVIGGFQHIVANFFIFWSGIFERNSLVQDHGSGPVVEMEVGKFIYNNLIGTAIGNWIGGAIIIPGSYKMINTYSK